MSIEDLSGETLLALGPGTVARTGSDGHVVVESLAGPTIDAGPDGFAILSFFHEPRTLADAMAELRGRPDGMHAAGVVMALIETGVLLDAAELGVRRGWADPVEHAWMLHDHRRTDAYLEAIRASVRPDDVVLDIGTGSGILAVAAAKAGARHVYALEASDIASVAQRVFEASGVADRITLLRGWSTQLDLPEPADLLVSEIIGAEPLEEEILEVTLDARRRLLAPGARMIPQRLQLFARPLAVPREERWARVIHADSIDELEGRYQASLAPLLEATGDVATHWPVEDATVAGWEPLGEPAEIAAFDLGSFTSTQVDVTADLTVHRGGVVDAILVTFRAHMVGDLELVHEPRADERSSWSSSVWFLAERVEVTPGSRLRVGYTRRVPGRADGLTCRLITVA